MTSISCWLPSRSSTPERKTTQPSGTQRQWLKASLSTIAADMLVVEKRHHLVTRRHTGGMNSVLWLTPTWVDISCVVCRVFVTMCLLCCIHAGRHTIPGGTDQQRL